MDRAPGPGLCAAHDEHRSLDRARRPRAMGRNGHPRTASAQRRTSLAAAAHPVARGEHLPPRLLGERARPRLWRHDRAAASPVSGAALPALFSENAWQSAPWRSRRQRSPRARAMAREGDAAARSCETRSAGLGREPPRPSTGAAPEDLQPGAVIQSRLPPAGPGRSPAGEEPEERAELSSRKRRSAAPSREVSVGVAGRRSPAARRMHRHDTTHWTARALSRPERCSGRRRRRRRAHGPRGGGRRCGRSGRWRIVRPRARGRRGAFGRPGARTLGPHRPINTPSRQTPPAEAHHPSSSP